MADFPGASVDSLLYHKYSITAPAFNHAEAHDFPALLAVDNLVAGNPGSAPTGQNDLAGVVAEEWSLGLDWFEKVHLKPKSPLNFGNIGGVVEREFEIFNAHRKLSVALTLVVNNATPGLDVPDVVAPDVLPAFASFLDPSSTDNSAGAGLGTLFQTVAIASAQGLPTFDTTIVFTFNPGGDLTLEVIGDRIALLSPEPDAPITEILGFRTEVIESLSGQEQRIALRKQPRQSFVLSYPLDGVDRRRMQAILFGWQPAVFALPLWHEAVTLRADASIGNTSVTVSTTTDVDFRVGGLAVVFSSGTQFDVVQVSAVGATSISFAASPLLNNYTAGHLTRVMPVRLAHLTRAPSHNRPPVNLETFDVEFRVVDNDTGALAGSTTGWSTYLGKVLLDDCNADGNNSGEMLQRITIVDNETGVVYQTSREAIHRRTHTKGFRADTRAEILKLRKLLLALRGKQKSFWIPTFNDDLLPVANLVSGSDELDIENIGYTRFIASQEPKRTFKITFTDGTSLIRVIQSSSEASSSVETLVLDTTWPGPANRTVDEVERIEFYELVRFDTDEFRLQYPRAGLALVSAPVKVVFEP